MKDTMHPNDEIQELLDERLSPSDAARVKAHLAGCPECREELAALAWVKRMAAENLTTERTPDDLEVSIRSALEGETSIRRRWRLAVPVAAVLATAAALLIWFIVPSRLDPVAAAARDYRSYRAGAIPLEISASSAPDAESFFSQRHLPFRARVFDLAMMGYRVIGARVHRLDGRVSALFVYEGEHGRVIVCQMYAGSVTVLPPPDAVRVHRDFHFHIHRREGLTLVFWQEGEVVCVLAGDSDPEEIVALAFEKAML